MRYWMGSLLAVAVGFGRSEQRVSSDLPDRSADRFYRKKDAGTLPEDENGRADGRRCDGADRRADIDRDPGTSACARLASVLCRGRSCRSSRLLFRARDEEPEKREHECEKGAGAGRT